MKKAAGILAGFVVIAAAWSAGPGFAASLNRNSRTLSAGNVAIPRCDTDGVSTLFTLSTSNVTSVAVSGISSGCGSQILSLTVYNGVTSQSGTATIAAGGGAVTVTLAAPIALTDSMHTAILI